MLKFRNCFWIKILFVFIFNFGLVNNTFSINSSSAMQQGEPDELLNFLKELGELKKNPSLEKLEEFEKQIEPLFQSPVVVAIIKKKIMDMRSKILLKKKFKETIEEIKKNDKDKNLKIEEALEILKKLSYNSEYVDNMKDLLSSIKGEEN